ncbi:MAG: hypothetical protein QOD31_110 [Pseudonocardiales bacterium]|nr:hypothetical protein [Pseudonocardiales bacterium]
MGCRRCRSEIVRWECGSGPLGLGTVSQGYKPNCPFVARHAEDSPFQDEDTDADGGCACGRGVRIRMAATTAVTPSRAAELAVAVA